MRFPESEPEIAALAALLGGAASGGSWAGDGGLPGTAGGA
jgi:hypothetical protein